MPDISMCLNALCPSNKKCYRYMAVPNEFRQTYAYFKIKEGEKKCESFWPIEEASTPLTREKLP